MPIDKHDVLKRTPLGRKVKELTYERNDWAHVRLVEATYDDTISVRSQYEGVLLQLVEDLEEEGYFLHRDSYNNAVTNIGDDDESNPGFEITVCAHDAHSNYA